MARFIVRLEIHWPGDADENGRVVNVARVEQRTKVFEAKATLDQLHEWVSNQGYLGETPIDSVTLSLDDDAWQERRAKKRWAS